MPRHGEPDSRVRNILGRTGSKIGALVLTVLGSTAAWFVSNHYGGAHQAVVNQREIAEDQIQMDLRSPAVQVFLDQPPSAWASWLSNEAMDIPPGVFRGIGNNGFPGDDHAIRADSPASHYSETEVSSGQYSFTLTGNHSTPVRITKIQAVIDARRPPPAGTVFYAVPQGAVGKEDFAIDLRSQDLNARVQDEDGWPTAKHYLDQKTVTLAKGESIGFNIMALAPFYDADIDYHLEITFDDESTVKVLNKEDKPFRMVSYPSRAARGYTIAKDGPDKDDLSNYGIFACSWPEQCRRNALGDWPFQQ